MSLLAATSFKVIRIFFKVINHIFIIDDSLDNLYDIDNDIDNEEVFEVICFNQATMLMSSTLFLP